MNVSFTFNQETTIQEFSKDDFWYELFDATYIKYFILCVSIMTLICLVPAFIFIFLHIQGKRFRTVLTYGENIVFLYAFFFLCVPFTMDIVRIFSGALPETVCWLTIFFKNFGVFGGQFGFVVCIILRYLYVIVSKSVGVFHDDVLGLFLHLLSFVFSFVAAFMHNYVPGKMGLNYYICTGEDPETYSYLQKKYPVSLLISMVTILVYTSISFRLAFAKRMMNYENDVAKTKPIRFFVAFAHGGVKKHDSIKQRRYNPEASGWFSECVPYVSNIAWSTLDLAILYICMFVIVGDSLLWNIKTKELTSQEIQTTVEGQFYFLFHQYFVVILIQWTGIVTTYTRKEALRKFVWDTIKDSIAY